MSTSREDHTAMAEEGPPARPPAFLLEMQRLTQEQEEELLKANPTQSVEFPDDELDEAREPWKSSMVGKVIGKRVTGNMLLDNLRIQWKDVQSGFEMKAMEEDYFIFRFNNRQDMQNVWRGSPWLVGDHPLALEEWTPDFRPSRNVTPNVAVWVRLPSLPVEYWNSKLLLKICAAAGTPLWLDSRTAEMADLSFARVCVLLDSEKPLAPGAAVGPRAKEGGTVGTRGKRFWQQFVYEIVCDCCFRCGRIGHRDSDCANLPALPLPIFDDSCGTKNLIYGPWLTTHRVNRQVDEAVAPLQAKPLVPTEELETATENDHRSECNLDRDAQESDKAYQERHQDVVKYSILDQLCCVLSLKKPTEPTPSFIPLTPLTLQASANDRLDDCKRLFNNFDVNHDGMISSAELLTFLRAVGQEISTEEAKAAVQSTDSRGDGLLCFEDFVKLANAEEVEAEDGESLKEAFKVYEREGEGCITPDSLRRALDRLGIERTIEECVSMIGEYDINGDGVICFDEFKVMMLSV